VFIEKVVTFKCSEMLEFQLKCQERVFFVKEELKISLVVRTAAAAIAHYCRHMIFNTFYNVFRKGEAIR
jgi:ABC-type polysaccharide/polyol phosphate transport system ATPase subunit